jgi:hypothetical protein
MSAFFAWLVRTIGITGCALLAFYLYEEGIPGAYKIALPASWPVVGGFGLVNIPVISDLTAGRVHTFAAQQVALATAASSARCDTRLEKMVSTVQYDALSAQLATERARRLVAEQLTTDADKRANAALKLKTAAQTALDKRIAADSGADGAVWTKEDIEWGKH